MNKEQVLSYCTELDKHAKKTGCEYEIYAMVGDSFSVTVMGGEIEDYRVNDYVGISFRIKKDGKMGYCSTTSADPDGIDLLIKEAISNASVIESKDEQFIFAGSEKYEYPLVYSPEADKIKPSEKIEIAHRLERAALEKDKRIIRTMGAVVFTESGVRIIKNSWGLSLSEDSNIIGAYVIPIASDGESMNSGMGYRVGWSIDDIDIDGIVNDACEEAIDFCSAGSCTGGGMKVILRASAMCELLGTFLPVFSSDNTQRGLSMLAGKEGELIAGECVTIIDDALLDHGYGSRAFDSEGVASQRNVIVENGVLKTLLYNLKTANKAGVKSTANASKGSYSSPIGISGTNFMITPSDTSLDELMQKAECGIMITSLEGLHSGANAVTGDFSLSAKGYLIEGGKKGRAVTGVTISGNFYTLLKNIECVGSDMKHDPFGTSVSSPSVLLNEPMSVSGGGE